MSEYLPTPSATKRVAQLVGEMGELTPSQRIGVFDLLRAVFCQHCGEEQPDDGVCYCQRDE